MGKGEGKEGSEGGGENKIHKSMRVVLRRCAEPLPEVFGD